MFTVLAIVFGIVGFVGFATVYGDSQKNPMRPMAVAAGGFVTVWAMLLAVFCALIATGRIL